MIFCKSCLTSAPPCEAVDEVGPIPGSLSPCPIFVEFRRKEWLKESVYNTLRELGAGFLCVDEPPLPSLIPPIVVNT